MTQTTQGAHQRRAEIEQRYIAEGFKIGLATDRSNVPEVQDAWRNLYRLGKLAPPALVWVVSGPIAAHVAMKLLACADPKETADDPTYFSPLVVDPALYTPAFFEDLWGSLVTSLGADRLEEYRDELAWLAKATLRAGTTLPETLRMGGLSYEHTCFWGAQEAYWPQWVRAEAEIGERTFTPEQWTIMTEYERTVKNAFWAWTFERACVVMERPSVQRTETTPNTDVLRYHGEDGPAVAFRDGYELYAWHGIQVSKQVIMAPETLTVETINAEPNAEVRRIMLERYGMERYIAESKSETLDRSDFGTLIRIPNPNPNPEEGAEDFVAVVVENSTPEPGTGIHEEWVSDGTGWTKTSTDTGVSPVYRKYIIPVPPTMQRAKEAVAWSFGMTESEYNPEIQT
jgi:hypothetical protein